MRSRALKIVINIILTLLTGTILYAQEVDSIVPIELGDSVTIINSFPVIPKDTALIDSLYFSTDSSLYMNDSLSVVGDSLLSDSIPKGGPGSEIDDLVNYDASDSLVFSMDGGTVEMYNQAIITYGDIKLEAGYIKYEMQKSEVLAYGIIDSTGKATQNPVFSQGDDSYEAKRIRYNFKTQKGFIEEVVTEMEGGFLHSRETKKQKSGHIHMKDGKYTTCDLEHPHFYVAITKGISMPGNKIVAGPAYMVFQDVPLPIGIPFGFFPNSRTKTSGILIPQYGEENNRGFYIRDGGYYFALNDYFDLRLTGDVYSNGTWGMRGGTNYRVRYKFNGNVNLQFFNNKSGFKGTPGYSKSKDYSINWSHAQAREANPNSNFRASVNLSSSSFDKQHTQRISSAVTNTKQSSISYTKNWPNSPFNLSSSLNHSQNSITRDVNMTLPKVSFNMGRITPFERKKRIGPKKWYEDVQLSYTSLLENKINTKDSLLFKKEVFNDMRTGFRHEVPLSLNIKPFKKAPALQSMTITPNVSYKAMVYNRKTEKSIIGYTEEETTDGTLYHPVIQDTIYENRFSYAQAYLPRISANVTPKIYGMYQFTGGGKVEAIRHVMTPSAGISYVPDMSAVQPDYYRELYDSVNNKLLQTYSIYENELYGTPTFNGASGSMSFSLKNNIEAKIRTVNDTVDEVKKVKLLDNLNFSSNYNLFNKDSLSPSWSPIAMSGNTRIFNNKLSVSFRGTFDPFAYNDLRNRTTDTYFSQSGRLTRLTDASITMGMSFSSQDGKEDPDQPEDEPDPLLKTAFEESAVNDPNNAYNPNQDDTYGDYVDFDVPWSLKLDYSFSYRKPKDVSSIIQTVRASGDLSLTPKWKIGFNTGYDLFNKKFSTTNLSLYRDLHCWEMRISVVPFGYYKSYNFQINAKSSILSDLKYRKDKPWTDNF